MKIKIYVANLGAYNRGTLRGEWITLPIDEDELEEAIKRILNTGEGDEEVAIHDYEAPFIVEEYELITELNQLMEELEDVKEDEDVIRAICEICDDRAQLLRVLKDREYNYVREVWTEKDLAERVDSEELPFDFEAVDKAGAAGYLDYGAIGHDLCLTGWHIAGGGLAVRIDA